MRILERYVFREVLQTWVAVTGVLLVILLSNGLASVLSRAADGQATRDVVLPLLWLYSLQELLILIPIGLFLAIMLAFGRLYHESELAAMQACGVGDAQLYKPVLGLSVIAALVLGYLAFVVVPEANNRQREIRDAALRETRFANLEPGKFQSFAGGDIVFYAESHDDRGFLHNVYTEQRVGNELKIMRSARAQQLGVGTAEQTFVLYEGERYEGVPGSAKFRITRFAELRIPINLPQVATAKITADMQRTATILESSRLEDRAELQWRIASPLMGLILAFLAVPLSRLRPRQGRYAKFAYFILVYLLYQYLLVAGRVWMERGAVPAILGLWWVHALVLVFALWLWRGSGALRFGLRRSATVAA